MVEQQDIYIDEGKSIGDFFGSLRRHRKLALLTAFGVFFAGAVITILWPNSYTSTATILIEEPEVPVELIQTTVTTYGSRQIQTISQRVMTRSNLAGIIEKFDLYADKRKYVPTLLLVEDVQEKIQLELVDIETADPSTGREVISTIAFTLGFEDESPTVARQVANELVSLYLAENVRTRTVQTVETSQFLATAADRLDIEVRAIEARLAEFKEQNEGSLPELADLNIQMMQRIDSDLVELTGRLNSITQSRIILESQLAQLSPTAPMVLPDGTVVISPDEQLKALQTQLALMEGRYGESHPDIIRLRRDISALQNSAGISEDLTETSAAKSAAKTDLIKARERYGDAHPEVKRLERLLESLEARSTATESEESGMPEPDNPAYLQIEASLKSLSADERSYREQQAQLQARLADYEQRLLRGPQVERELTALQRDLSTTTTRFLTMREKLFGAEMGESLETASKGERFTLVEPPNLPLEPSSPNRAALLLLLILLAPACGIGIVLVKDTLDDAIWGPKAVLSVQGALPIAEIPFIANPEDIEQRQRSQRMMLIGIPSTIIVAMLIIHFAVARLDVLWYQAMRQLGL